MRGRRVDREQSDREEADLVRSCVEAAEEQAQADLLESLSATITLRLSNQGTTTAEGIILTLEPPIGIQLQGLSSTPSADKAALRPPGFMPSDAGWGLLRLIQKDDEDLPLQVRIHPDRVGSFKIAYRLRAANQADVEGVLRVDVTATVVERSGKR
jgi:hypothetical protein